MSVALIAGGAFLVVIILIVVVVMMMGRGGEKDDSPSPSATAEEEPVTAVEKSQDMLAEVAEVAEADEPVTEKEQIQKVEVAEDTPSESPDKVDGLVGWYDADSWNSKANEWKDKSKKKNHVTEVKGEPDVDEDDGVKFVFGGKKVGLRFPQDVMTRGKKYTLFHVTKYNGEARGRIFDGLDSNYLSGFWAGRHGGVAHRNGSSWITNHNSEKDDKWVLSTDMKNVYRKNGLQRSGLTNNRAVIPTRVTINYGQFTHGEKRGDSTVTLYKHCGYGGRSVSRASGSYDMANIGMRNDDVSSVRVPKGMEIEIFEHGGFKGKSKKFTSDDDCFVNDGFNDILSSYVIRNTSEGGLGPESSDWAVAEVIFYDRELDLSDVQQVEAYLHKKYKIRKDIRSEIWTPSFVKNKKSELGSLKDLDGAGMTCGSEGVMRSTRLHSHHGSNRKYGNGNFQHEGICIQGGVVGQPSDKTSSYVDANAEWFSKYKELVDKITCRESAITAYQFESSKDGSKVRVKHSCNGEIEEDSCTDVVAKLHRHNHNPNRLTNDGLFSAMHYQELQCGVGQALTKMKLEKNDKGGAELRGTCCALKDI
jgi:hypothetical protein